MSREKGLKSPFSFIYFRGLTNSRDCFIIVPPKIDPDFAPKF